MIEKIEQQVITIDIHGAYTQWGKTSLFVNEIATNPGRDFLVAMPNSILSKNEIIKKINEKMKEKGRTNFFIFDVSKLKGYTSVYLENKILEHHDNEVQVIYVIMGNVHQLGKRGHQLFVAIHAVHNVLKRICTDLILDESDIYLIAHENVAGKATQRDREFDTLIEGAPRFGRYLFYTATIYTHAFWAFGDESYKEQFKINWHRLKEGENYWHFRDINFHTNNDLSDCFEYKDHKYVYTGFFDPIAEVIDSQPHKGGSLYIHLMMKVEGQDKIRDEILKRYSHLAIITANEEGVLAYKKSQVRSFNDLNSAADWCLEDYDSIVWIGGASLERMMTLTDTEAKLLLNGMILFGKKSHISGVVQVIGRMTGRYKRENWIRNLYAPQEAIEQINSAVNLEKYFNDKLKRNSTISQEDFLNMPSHPGSLVPIAARMGTNKLNHSTPPINTFKNKTEAELELGKKHIMHLQSELNAEKSAIESTKNGLKGGQNTAGEDNDHYRKLLASDPSNAIFNRPTIFNTPDGKHIDNRDFLENRDKAMDDENIQYLTTINSDGYVLAWEKNDVGTSKNSYVKKELVSS